MVIDVQLINNAKVEHVAGNLLVEMPLKFAAILEKSLDHGVMNIAQICPKELVVTPMGCVPVVIVMATGLAYVRVNARKRKLKRLVVFTFCCKS